MAFFPNHMGITSGVEFTDTIWVYWSGDPLQWNPSCKAVVLNGSTCSWSRRYIGMPSVVLVRWRLDLFYDGPAADSISHMHRDIGLAWLDLPIHSAQPESFQ